MPQDTIFREYDVHDAERSDRSAGDRQRHSQKVREAIKKNIGKIISEESIIGKDGDKTVKVPIKGIKEYRFVYGDNHNDVMEGDGDSKPGDVVGQRHSKGMGKSVGRQGGSEGGEDVYETDVTINELVDIMMEDLGLPDMERKSLKQIETDKSFKRKGYRRAGIRVRLDKFKTIKEKIKRENATKRILGETANELV